HATDPLPRRADARPRSAEPQPALDPGQALERERRRHRLPDDPLHGRSRSRGTPDRDHRPWPDRGAGIIGGAQGANQNRIARGRVPRPDRIDDPRRARGCRRSDAPDGEDVEGAVSAIYILWLRELKRYSRSRAQVVASLGQPLLYLLVLGFGLGPVFQQAGRGSYLQFVAPGVIGMSVLFTSIFSGLGLLWDRQFGFLKETLVAPVPRLHIMIGRTLGAATVSMVQGLLVFVVCLVAGFRPVS